MSLRSQGRPSVPFDYYAQNENNGCLKIMGNGSYAFEEGNEDQF